MTRLNFLLSALLLLLTISFSAFAGGRTPGIEETEYLREASGKYALLIGLEHSQTVTFSFMKNGQALNVETATFESEDKPSIPATYYALTHENLENSRKMVLQIKSGDVQNRFPLMGMNQFIEKNSKTLEVLRKPIEKIEDYAKEKTQILICKKSIEGSLCTSQQMKKFGDTTVLYEENTYDQLMFRIESLKLND